MATVIYNDRINTWRKMKKLDEVLDKKQRSGMWLHGRTPHQEPSGLRGAEGIQRYRQVPL